MGIYGDTGTVTTGSATSAADETLIHKIMHCLKKAIESDSRNLLHPAR